jgi:hypothetical protein
VDRNRVGLVLDCLNDGLESPLYQEIRELQGLSYFSGCALNPLLGVNVPMFYALTVNRNRRKLRETYQKFFTGDLSRHITWSRFSDCYSSIMARKKLSDLLPHEGAALTVLQDSPFDGLEGFSYQESLALLDKYFKIETFKEFAY